MRGLNFGTPPATSVLCRNLRRQERTADPANRRGDPPRAGQTGEITAEVAAAQEPSRAAGGSDGPPRPPRADNRP